jgi:glycosyltransferase 2 family protein
MRYLEKNPWLSHLLKFALAIAILWWLFRSGKIDFNAIKRVWAPGSAALILGLVFCGYLTIAIRWNWLLTSQKIVITYYQTLRLALIGLFFNFALPGGVSGDLVKAYYIARNHPEQKMTTVISVGIDRFLGVTAMMAMAFIVMSFDNIHVFAEPELTFIFFAVAGMLLGLLVLSYFMFSKNGYHSRPMIIFKKYFARNSKVALFLDSAHKFGERGDVLWRALFLSLAGQVISTLMFVYVGSMIAPDVRWTAYFFCVPIGMMLTAIPISPGGVGVGQAAFYFLFTLYTGEKSDLGPTLMTIYQMFSFVCGLAGAYFYLQHRSHVRHEKQQA